MNTNFMNQNMEQNNCENNVIYKYSLDEEAESKYCKTNEINDIDNYDLIKILNYTNEVWSNYPRKLPRGLVRFTISNSIVDIDVDLPRRVKEFTVNNSIITGDINYTQKLDVLHVNNSIAKYHNGNTEMTTKNTVVTNPDGAGSVPASGSNPPKGKGRGRGRVVNKINESSSE